MRTLPILVLVTLGTACQEPPVFDSEVSAAFESLVAATRAKDGGKLWDLSPAPMRAELQALFESQSAAVSAVRAAYPESDRAAALENLGASLLEGAKDGRDLFIALIDFDRFATSPGAERGLAIQSLTINGTEALLTTVAGEAFRFIKEGADWRATAFQIQLEASAGLKRLRANIAVAEKNLSSWDRAVQETTDRGKPEGTFNVLFEAVRRGARVMVFELLDPGSRKQIASGTEATHALQKGLERSFPDLAARARYLADRKLGWVERVADERALFAALWDAGVLTEDLPPEGASEIDRVERKSDDRVVIHTRAKEGPNRQYTFVRDPAKRWCFGGLEATLEREGLRKIEAETRSLPPPPVAPPATP